MNFKWKKLLVELNLDSSLKVKAKRVHPAMDVAGGSIRAAISRWELAVWRQYQHVLDKWTPLVGRRWVGLLVVALMYALRVYLVEGFYLVSYGLGIYILNLLIGFLSPQVDPEILDGEGPTLPSSVNDEFRPFVRRLPEFKFWFVIFLHFLYSNYY